MLDLTVLIGALAGKQASSEHGSCLPGQEWLLPYVWTCGRDQWGCRSPWGAAPLLQHHQLTHQLAFSVPACRVKALCSIMRQQPCRRQKTAQMCMKLLWPEEAYAGELACMYHYPSSQSWQTPVEDKCEKAAGGDLPVMVCSAATMVHSAVPQVVEVGVSLCLAALRC